MAYRMRDFAYAWLLSIAGSALATGGCSSVPASAPPLADTSSTAAPEPPFDVLRPGAALLCDRPEIPEGAPGRTMYFVISAMNFKLQHYPQLAAAIGLNLVTDCDSALRYDAGLSAYSAEHPGFDADEPLAPLALGGDDAPSATEVEMQDPPEVRKIFGGNLAVDNSVVRLEYETCTKTRPGGARCPAADSSWKVNGQDLRGFAAACSGTFIAKNWILTAAHCATLSGIDQCMENGIARSQCKPNWDHYARWRIRGSFSVDHGMDGIPSNDDTRREYEFFLQARTYVIPNWPGRDLSLNPETCDGCQNSTANADDDLALLYVSTNEDPVLPPRTDDDAAKRISTISPDPSWPMSLEGWGRSTPGAPTALRNVNGPWPFEIHDQRMTVLAEPNRYPCPGDSGGPLTRREVVLDTADGRRPVDAIIGVISNGTAKCLGPEATPTQEFSVTRVDTPRHQKFIKDSMQRWPYLRNFECTKKGPISGNIEALEVMECWGAPCQQDGPPCKGNELCWHSARDVDELPPACNCFGFASPFDQGCNCIVGQCVPE